MYSSQVLVYNNRKCVMNKIKMSCLSISQMLMIMLDEKLSV